MYRRSFACLHYFPTLAEQAGGRCIGTVIARRQRMRGIEELELRVFLAAWGTIPYLMDQPAASSKYKAITGKGQTVAILDTGVDYNHPALGGGWGKVVIGGYDFVNNDSNPMDESGHGTMVAGAIAAKPFVFAGRKYQGIASGAKIVALRVEDNSDYLPDSRIKAALDWVIRYRTKYHISVVNMSFGDGDFSSKTQKSIYSPELAQLAKAGVFIAAASGNEGIGNPPGVNYPGADHNVYAIGSVNSSDVISRFTSRGPDLDLLAPGENVPLPIYNPSNGSEYYTLGSGTSFSTAIASGAALLVKQVNPHYSATQVGSILKSSGVPNIDGDVESPATGLTFRRIDLYNAIAVAYRKKTIVKKVKRIAAPQPASAPFYFGSALIGWA
jgi:subtilisin family serine protease